MLTIVCWFGQVPEDLDNSLETVENRRILAEYKGRYMLTSI